MAAASAGAVAEDVVDNNGRDARVRPFLFFIHQGWAERPDIHWSTV